VKVKLNSGSLNVRKGPSTNQPKVGMLANGTVVEMLGTSGDWTQIKNGNLTGYVYTKYVVKTTDTPAATPTPKPTTTNAPQSGSAYVKLSRTNSYLNLREGTGTNTRVLTTVKHGTQVTVLGTSGDWTQVKVGNTTGYVATKYLSQTTPTQGTATPAPQQTEKSGTVTASALNMRKGPSSSTAIVRSLNHGTQVTILGTSGGWYHVRVGNQEGYAYKTYIKVS